MFRHISKAIYTFIFLLCMFCISFVLHLTVFGVPAVPGAQTIKQADGSQITIYLYGDEYLSWTEDGNRSLIALGQDGNYYYAEWTSNGPIATNQKVPRQSTLVPIKEGTPAPAIDAKHTIPQSIIDKARQERLQNETSEISTQRKLLGSTADAVPERKIPVLVIHAIPGDYQDKSKFKMDPTSTNYIKQKVFDESDNALSLANYYKRQSYGKISLEPVKEDDITNNGSVDDGIVTVYLNNPHEGDYPSNEYAKNNCQEAITKGFEKVRNIGLYSSDKLVMPDEISVIIILHGNEYSTSPQVNPGVWGSASSASTSSPYYINANYNLYRYCVFGSIQFPASTPRYFTLGIVAHEFGHLALKFKDVYDTSASANKLSYVDQWSVMGSGSWGSLPTEPRGARPTAVDPYNLTKYGIVKPKTIDNVVGEPLDPTGVVGYENAVIKVNANGKNSNQYFLLQARTKDDLFDQSAFNYVNNDVSDTSELHKNSGVLIFHVNDESGSANNQIPPPLLTIEEAHGGIRHLLQPIRRPSDLADLYGRSKTTFDANTDPNSNFHSGSATDSDPTGVKICHIILNTNKGEGYYLVDVNPVSPKFKVNTDTFTVTTGIGESYNAKNQLQEGTEPITYSITSNPSNPGININGTTGVIDIASTVPVGTYTVTITATNKHEDAQLVLTITVIDNIDTTVPPEFDIDQDVLTVTTGIGGIYNAKNQLKAGTEPITYSIVSNPSNPGITINDTTGVINVASNVPVGIYVATITATNSKGSAQLVLTITVIDNTASPKFKVDTDTLTVTTGIGGTYDAKKQLEEETESITYSMVSNPSNPGITINSTTGVVKVASTVPVGTYEVTITATNSKGSTQLVLTITIIDNIVSSSLTIDFQGIKGVTVEYYNRSWTTIGIFDDQMSKPLTELNIPDGTSVIRLRAKGMSYTFANVSLNKNDANTLIAPVKNITINVDVAVKGLQIGIAQADWVYNFGTSYNENSTANFAVFDNNVGYVVNLLTTGQHKQSISVVAGDTVVLSNNLIKVDIPQNVTNLKMSQANWMYNPVPAGVTSLYILKNNTNATFTYNLDGTSKTQSILLDGTAINW